MTLIAFAMMKIVEPNKITTAFYNYLTLLFNFLMPLSRRGDIHSVRGAWYAK